MLNGASWVRWVAPSISSSVLFRLLLFDSDGVYSGGSGGGIMPKVKAIGGHGVVHETR